MGMGLASTVGWFKAPFSQLQAGQLRANRIPGNGSPGFPNLQPEVSGFSAAAVDKQIVAGLPEGVTLPANALTAIAALKRLDVWIDKGRRAQAWAEQRGAADVSWVDEDGVLGLPDALRNEAAPAFVGEWLSESAEIGTLVEQLLT